MYGVRVSIYKTLAKIVCLRAMALYRWMAGEPGGFRSRAASPIAVCFTVNVCLKSSGNDICAGSRFNS